MAEVESCGGEETPTLGSTATRFTGKLVRMNAVAVKSRAVKSDGSPRVKIGRLRAPLRQMPGPGDCKRGQQGLGEAALPFLQGLGDDAVGRRTMGSVFGPPPSGVWVEVAVIPPSSTAV